MTKATSFRDPFVRPSSRLQAGGAQAGAPVGAVAGAFGMASDAFRDAAAGKAAKMFAARPDAFAAKKAGAPNAIPNPFDPAPREVAMRPEKVTVAEPVSPPPAASPKVRVLKNGASLKVVQPGAESMDDIRAEFEEKVRRNNPVRARFASLATAMMATGAAAGAATASGGEAGSAETTDSRRRARSGGGGGREPPKIDRAFNQDDLMAVLIVLALLLMLGIYFVRGNGAPKTAAPQQLAASEKIVQPQAAPAAPPAPLKDPYGDQPLDLTPKVAPPAEVAVAPTPAPVPAPACKAGHTMRAFFCTDRAELTDNSKVALEKELADWTSCFKDRELVVTGYADTRGPAVYNTYLGETRAKSVADFLRGRGIKVAQLTGVGELDGLADNENCANQRRVDISFAGESGEAPSRSCAPPEDLAALVCG